MRMPVMEATGFPYADRVEPGGAAARAGVQNGDIVVTVGTQGLEHLPKASRHQAALSMLAQRPLEVTFRRLASHDLGAFRHTGRLPSVTVQCWDCGAHFVPQGMTGLCEPCHGARGHAETVVRLEDAAQSLGLSLGKTPLGYPTPEEIGRGGAAAAHGVQMGDVIVSVNGESLAQMRPSVRRDRVVELAARRPLTVVFVRPTAPELGRKFVAPLCEACATPLPSAAAGECGECHATRQTCWGCHWRFMAATQHGACPACAEGKQLFVVPLASSHERLDMSMPASGKDYPVAHEVEPGGRSAREGVRNGDVVVSIGGEPTIGTRHGYAAAVRLVGQRPTTVVFLRPATAPQVAAYIGATVQCLTCAAETAEVGGRCVPCGTPVLHCWGCGDASKFACAAPSLCPPCAAADTDAVHYTDVSLLTEAQSLGVALGSTARGFPAVVESTGQLSGVAAGDVVVAVNGRPTTATTGRDHVMQLARQRPFTVTFLRAQTREHIHKFVAPLCEACDTPMPSTNAGECGECHATRQACWHCARPFMAATQHGACPACADGLGELFVVPLATQDERLDMAMPASGTGFPVAHEVEPGGRAERAGVRNGDVVVSIGGQATKPRQHAAAVRLVGRRPTAVVFLRPATEAQQRTYIGATVQCLDCAARTPEVGDHCVPCGAPVVQCWGCVSAKFATAAVVSLCAGCLPRAGHHVIKRLEWEGQSLGVALGATVRGYPGVTEVDAGQDDAVKVGDIVVAVNGRPVTPTTGRDRVMELARQRPFTVTFLRPQTSAHIDKYVAPECEACGTPLTAAGAAECAECHARRQACWHCSRRFMSTVEHGACPACAEGKALFAVQLQTEAEHLDMAMPASGTGFPVAHEVEPGGRAERAGVRNGDVVVSIGGNATSANRHAAAVAQVGRRPTTVVFLRPTTADLQRRYLGRANTVQCLDCAAETPVAASHCLPCSAPVKRCWECGVAKFATARPASLCPACLPQVPNHVVLFARDEGSKLGVLLESNARRFPEATGESDPLGAGAQMGVQPGDVVVAVNGVPVEPGQLDHVKAQCRQRPMEVTFLRPASEQHVSKYVSPLCAECRLPLAADAPRCGGCGATRQRCWDCGASFVAVTDHGACARCAPKRLLFVVRAQTKADGIGISLPKTASGGAAAGEVAPGGAAELAGVRSGDVVVAVNDQSLPTAFAHEAVMRMVKKRPLKMVFSRRVPVGGSNPMVASTPMGVAIPAAAIPQAAPAPIPQAVAIPAAAPIPVATALPMAEAVPIPDAAPIPVAEALPPPAYEAGAGADLETPK